MHILELIRTQLSNQFVSGGLMLMFTGSLVALFRSLPVRSYTWVKSRFVRQVTIENKDPLFDYVTYWLNSQERFSRSRVLRATTELRLERERSREVTAPGSDRGSKKMQVFFSPSHGRHFFRHGGQIVSISRIDTGNPAGRSGVKEMDSGMGGFRSESYQLEVYGNGDGKVLKDLIQKVVDFGSEETEGVRLYYTTWGHWQSNGYQRMRPLSTVLLPTGQTEAVLADMQEFRGDQAWYRNLGIPWHRGYLFYGFPGTGKTSLAAALAGELQMDVYLLSLSGIGMNDETLQRLMADVRPGCMVIMEDVDCTIPDRDAGPNNNRITLSGLLNCLDGIMAREGCLIVMTTNRREVLDSALVRPGRIDMELPFGHADHDQIVRMAVAIGVSCDGIYGESMTMAEVQKELLARYKARRSAAHA